MDNTESEGNMGAEQYENTVETRENNAINSERDPTMAEVMSLLMEMRREMNELKTAIKPRPGGAHSRLQTTIRYGNADIPVNIETGSGIEDRDESDDGEPIPAIGSGGNGENGRNGTGMTLRIPRSGWVKDPFEELKYYGETDK